MTLAPVIGNHAYLVMEGETVDTVTVSSSAYPDIDPVTNWRTLGCVRKADYQHAYEGETKIKCPSPGSYKTRQSVYKGTNTTIDFELNDITNDMWKLIMGAASISSGVFAPGSQGQPPKGWLKLQMYESSTEDNIVNLLVWGEFIVPTTTSASEDLTTAQMRVTILDNALNSGELLNSALT